MSVHDEVQEELQQKYAEIANQAPSLLEMLDAAINPPKKWWQFWKAK